MHLEAFHSFRSYGESFVFCSDLVRPATNHRTHRLTTIPFNSYHSSSPIIPLCERLRKWLPAFKVLPRRSNPRAYYWAFLYLYEVSTSTAK